MKTNKKYLAEIGISIMLVILLCSCISSFGIGCAYHKDHPLKIAPGETKEIIFNLQNMPGPENITTSASISKGAEILEIIDSENILVIVGGSVDVKAKVVIPSDANVGEIYPVEVTFTTITKSESGEFGFGSSVGRSFEVIVISTGEEIVEPKPITLWIVYLIIGIIILIIWLKLRKKK